MKRINITRAAALVGVAGLLGLASTAIAADQKPAAKPAAPAYTDPATLPKFKNVVVINATAEQRATANAAPTAPMVGQKAYVNPLTGELRPAAIEDLVEAAAMPSAAPAAAEGAAASNEIVVENGGVVGLLDESTFVYSVAHIGPDGKAHYMCADQHLNSEAALEATKAAQEHSHEK